ncbi:pyridoxal phosphate-dependent aminotransferase [Clostridium sp. CX1]|uniref:MalY/PatB family protein n=1 Tax=Clostridium sp. CX1 TaxID=2978346 RepID=UPI0021C0E4F9|nr:MalY/PatB family protein [Clostridium sp. CX1]MCT8977778.1 pyridoxal phosphate-dependent aminotransferase [Clostridium sp. CX1]
MKYNFDEIIDRTNTNSIKWNFNKELLGYEDVIPMWIADMDFKTVPEVTEAIKKRAEHGIYGYSDGMDSYFNSVIKWMKRRHGFEVEKEWICTCPGIVPALHFILKACTNPGDRIIIQSPVYYPFYDSILHNHCEIVNNPLKFEEGKYTMDFQDLEKKIKEEKVRLLIICNPHNPVGRVWSKEELTKLGKICIENNVIVISDEIHSDLVFKDYKHTSFASISETFRENSITCTAPSKTFNIAGLQVSNVIISNRQLREKFKETLLNHGIKRLNLFGIIACEAAYNYGEQWLEELIEYLEDNKRFLNDFIKERIPKLKVVNTEGTYLVWIDCRKLGMTEEQLKLFMLTKAKVAFDEGFIFGQGGEGFERINIACPRTILKEALEKIEKAVNSL